MGKQGMVEDASGELVADFGFPALDAPDATWDAWALEKAGRARETALQYRERDRHLEVAKTLQNAALRRILPEFPDMVLTDSGEGWMEVVLAEPNPSRPEQSGVDR